jgi:hypothetical protein
MWFLAKEPLNNALSYVEKDKFINSGISKYVEFKMQSIVKDETYACVMGLHVNCWEDVLVHLLKPLIPWSAILLKGFWLSSNWRSNHAKVSLPNTFDIIDVKDPKISFYCVLKNMRPSLMIVMYTNFRDLNVRFFVIVKLHDPKLVHVWTKKQKMMSWRMRMI